MAIGRLAGAVYAARSGTQDAVLRLRATTPIHAIDKVTDNTATVADVEKVQLESSGTAAAGLGSRKSWVIENASGNAATIARMDAVVVTATDGAEDGKLDFYVNVAGTVTKVFSLGTTGPTFTVSTTLDFSGGATNFALKDNTATALTIKQGSNTYMSFDTTDNAEIITIGPASAIGTATFGIALQGRVTTTDGVTSGTARVVGGRAYTNTAASTAVSNTTTETLASTSYSIPADTLKAGTLVKIRYQGIAPNTNSTDTLTVKLYIGGLTGTALISHAATDVSDNDVFQGEYELIIRTAGASGTMVGCGTYKSIPAAEGTMTVKDDILASTTINTTTAQVVGVGFTWSAASAANNARLDFLRVEIY